MLEEVSGSVSAICLGARTGVDPDTDGSGLSGRVGLSGDSETVGKSGGLGDGLAGDGSGQVAKVEGSGGGRYLLGSGEPQGGLRKKTSSHGDERLCDRYDEMNRGDEVGDGREDLTSSMMNRPTRTDFKHNPKLRKSDQVAATARC